MPNPDRQFDHDYTDYDNPVKSPAPRPIFKQLWKIYVGIIVVIFLFWLLWLSPWFQSDKKPNNPNATPPNCYYQLDEYICE